jgi:hypothetical protein
MGWSIGDHGGRDIGYGVPAVCDKPGCDAEIDRGLSYVCGGQPYGGEVGCGLFFCDAHLFLGRSEDAPQLCPRCFVYKPMYRRPSPDTEEWIRHKLTDDSWQQWRDDNPDEVVAISRGGR